MTSSVISKLADIDPVFREVATALYPEMDPRELYTVAKAMPDTSAVHVNNSGKKSNSGKKKLAAGLIAGAGIEAAAAGETIAPLKRDIKAFSATRKASGTLKAIKPLVPHGVGLSRWGSGTKAALMGGNLLVGLGAARELAKPKQPKQSVAKAAPEMMAAFEQILTARRRGEIDTPTALALIERVTPEEMVSKGAAGRVARKVAGVVPPGGHFTRIGEDAKALHGFALKRHTETTGYQWEKSINRGRKAAGAAAFAGAGGVGYHVRNKQLQRRQGVRKAAEESVAAPQLEWDGAISKVNDERRQVFGWCSLSKVNGEDVVDLQDDYVPIEEIEKAAYKYVITSRKGGDMHKRVGKGIYAQDEPLHTADLIESVIVTPDKLRSMGVPEEAISKVHTGWWVGFQVNDEDQWRMVKSGERAGFSIHGTGTRKMVEA